MRFSTMLYLFFILYCFEAGMLLLFAPWSPEWDRIMLQLPILSLRDLLLHPWTRGAVTGFGMVHLVWGAHDLIALILRRPPLARARPRQSNEPPDVRAAGDQ